MEIKTEIRKDGRVPVTVLFIAGDIDSLNSSELEEKGRKLYEEGSRRMVLEMSQVRYVNSAGLRAIHTLYNLLRSNFPAETDQMLEQMIKNKRRSRLLKIAGANQAVIGLLSTSGYDLFLEVHENLDSAIQSF